MPGVGRARATNPDELPGDATSKHGSDPQHDDVGSTDKTPSRGWRQPRHGTVGRTTQPFVSAK